MEYNSLKTGKNYNLKDLFFKDNKIIIPDLQRDYCWGETVAEGQSQTLAYNFVSGLLENENKDDEFNLGLIYGYEAPLGHIQLCDGQQRITTLFLLLGMLNKKTNGEFESLLVSENEKNDDYEPYLQYAIRESSLYFLSDLVRHFFAKDCLLKVKSIKEQSWYFDDYNYDPSIISMIKTMEVIENLLAGYSKDDCSKFGDYISNKLTFLYFDMENRKKGEETFVVINTTGEPLSQTENLKPILIGDDKDGEKAKEWERWEKFFWRHRDKKNVDTADEGFKQFFRWVVLLENADDKSTLDREHKDEKSSDEVRVDPKKINFYTIKKYFLIVEDLFKENGVLSKISGSSKWISGPVLSQADLFQLLPLIEFCKKFEKTLERDKLRVAKFYESCLKNTNVSKSVADLIGPAIHLIKKLPNMDIAEVINIPDASTAIVNPEVNKKMSILLNEAKDNAEREKWEELFWEEEKYPIWDGEIKPLLDWATNDNHQFIEDIFNSYKANLRKLFDAKRDLIIRALLSKNAQNYPHEFDDTHGYLCFGNLSSHWKQIVAELSPLFKELLDEIDFNDVVSSIEDICKVGHNSVYQDFIDEPAYLEYCTRKTITDTSENMILLKKTKKVKDFIFFSLYKFCLECKKLYPQLKIFTWESHCFAINFDEQGGNAVDVISADGKNIELQVFHRNHEEQSEINTKLAEDLGLYEKDCGDEKGMRYVKENLSKAEAKDLIDKIIRSVNK
jgi:uncharacterized protein with ParB-like and HNH nuclease domain